MKTFNAIILLLLVSYWGTGCATTPKPLTGDVAFPQTFEKVWFRPTLEKPGFAAMTDTGDLVINKDSLEFKGEEKTIVIKFPDIKDVTYGKIGTDFINNWVRIDYGEGTVSHALFSAGKALGWGGGSDKIYATVKYAMEQNTLRSKQNAGKAK